MQWADASLLDFVEYLLEWSRSSPALRRHARAPRAARAAADLGRGHRNFTSLYLEPLSARRCSELLDGLVPGLPDELREQILARAEGVPLYAVETVRMLLDRGLLVQEGSVYRPTGDDRVARGARDAARADRRAARRPARRGAPGAPGRRRARQDVHASRRSPRSRGSRRPSSSRCSLARPQGDPRRPGRSRARPSTASTASSRTWCARSPTRRSRRRSARRGTSRRPPTSRRFADEDEIVEVARVALPRRLRGRSRTRTTPARSRRRRGRARPRRRARRRRSARRGGAALLRAGGRAHRRPARARRSCSSGPGTMAWTRRTTRRGARAARGAIALFEARATHAPGRPGLGALAEIEWHRGRTRRRRSSGIEAAFEALVAGRAGRGRRRLAAQLGRLTVFTRRARAGARAARARARHRRGAAPAGGSRAGADEQGAILYGARKPAEEARVLLEHALELALEHDLPDAAIRATSTSRDRSSQLDRYEEALELPRRALELARRVGDRLGEWLSSAERSSAVHARPLGRGPRDVATSSRGAARREATTSSLLGPPLRRDPLRIEASSTRRARAARGLRRLGDVGRTSRIAAATWRRGGRCSAPRAAREALAAAEETESPQGRVRHRTSRPSSRRSSRRSRPRSRSATSAKVEELARHDRGAPPGRAAAVPRGAGAPLPGPARRRRGGPRRARSRRAEPASASSRCRSGSR